MKNTHNPYENMLKIRNLCANFENEEILRSIDLTVNEGEIHVVLGPNGSGKSTLGRVILGDPKYKQTDGSIEFLGKDFNDLSISDRAKLGFFLSFQAPPEIDGVSVKNLLFAAKKATNPSFSSSFKFKKGLIQDLEKMRLSDEFIDREMNKGFSGGERKKIEMVSLLTLDPKLVFLDEIDSGVDVDAINAIANGINKFLEDKTKSAILVSHSEKLLEKVRPTHVHVLCHGKITHTGGIEILERIHKHGFDDFLPKKMTGFRVVS